MSTVEREGASSTNTLSASVTVITQKDEFDSPFELHGERRAIKLQQMAQWCMFMPSVGRHHHPGHH